MAFLRAFELVIAPAPVNGVQAPSGIDVSLLRCKFRVKKTLKPKPNHAVIEVYNLCPDNQRFLESSKALSVRLEAGYQDEGVSQIYLGEVFSAETRKDGDADVITKCSTDDKGRKHQTAQIHIPVGAGASVESVIKLILGGLNDSSYFPGPSIGVGNLAAVMKKFNALGVTSLHPRGGVLSGYAAQVMTDLCQSAGLEWSIYDGNLYITLANVATGGRSLVLSSTSGLIGSPVVDNEGVVKADVLMIPGLKPGIVVDFQSEYLTGGYRLIQVEYVGDTHGTDWHAKITGTKY